MRFPVCITGLRMNNSYIIPLFIKTEVIFAFVERKFTERTFENLKLWKMIVKVNYLESFKIWSE